MNKNTLNELLQAAHVEYNENTTIITNYLKGINALVNPNVDIEVKFDIEANANNRTTSGESSYNVDSFKEYKIVRSKSIIDEIDDYICPLYGLTKEETEFIKNY